MSILSKRPLLAVVALAGALLVGGGVACNKPSAASCKQALHNMQRLLGTANLTSADQIGGAVNRCRGASKRDAVKCAIDAQTLEQLQACTFYKDVGGDLGSASSAGSGSADAPATK